MLQTFAKPIQHTTLTFRNAMDCVRQVALKSVRSAIGCGAGALTAVLLACSPQVSHSQAASAAQFTSLHSFGDGNDGRQPACGVSFDVNGNVVGDTMSGGVSGDGVVYTIRSNGVYGVLHSFTDAEGSSPLSPLTVLTNGNVCGSASSGAGGAGALFQLNAENALSTMHSFSNFNTNGSYTNGDGGEPVGGLTMGSDGNLYGTTSLGGAQGGGTIFRLTLSGGFTTLHAFGTFDGALPDSTLVLSNGALYGVTSAGGANGTGTIFKITQSGSFTTLYSFSADTGSGNADGANPYGKLCVDGAGTIYGTAFSGGKANSGTLFELSKQGVFNTLHTFGTIDLNGKLSTNDGANPLSGVTAGPDGDLYGTTVYGGANEAGTIFRVDATGAFATIFTFDSDGGGNQTGSYPAGALTFGPDGALYGVAFSGGESDAGTLYKLTVSRLNSEVDPRFDFNKDGHPDLLWYNTASGAVSQWLMDDQSVLQFGSAFASVDPATGWQPVASPDINGDGYPDLIWWNSSTGELCAWTLQGSTVLTYGGDFAQVADTNWQPVATADDNGVAWTLVFQNRATGEIARWLMNGSAVAQFGGTIASLGSGNAWQIAGAPDLDGDGKSDLLFWNDQTGEVSWWGCDLTNDVVNSYNGDIGAVSDTNWHLVGSEDTNGDGQSDLVWWNAANGAASRWLLDGTSVTQYGGVTTEVSDTTWQPTALR